MLTACLLQLARPSVSKASDIVVVFSKSRGFYDEPFELTLECATPGSEMRYTLNGSLPDPDAGILYTGPITISNTTIVRAIAFLSGSDTSGVATHTYIFPEKVVHQPPAPLYADGTPYPADWKGVAADYEMDPEVLLIEGQERVVNALMAIPSLSIVMNDDDLFQKIMNGGGKGINDGLESPATMEMIYPVNPLYNFQMDCGFEPRSRNLEGRAIKRGFEVKFKEVFGPKKLRFAIFFNAPRNRENATAEFDNLVLRPGFCDTWSSKGYSDIQDTYTRDPITREAYLDVTGTGTHNHFVHLYLNGLYWGLYNLAEKVDENFLISYLGGEEEDWLVVKSNTDSDDDGQVNNGDDTRYQQLLDLVGGYEGHGPLQSLYEDKAYRQVCSLIDPVLFAQYIMVHCYHGPGDWPDNNWYFVMLNDPPRPGFFQIWDAEKSLADYAGDGRPHAWYTPLLTETDTRGGRAVPSRIWKAMITNPDFRMIFADKVYRSLMKTDGELTNERSIQRWNQLNGFIGAGDREHAAIIGESARWGDVNIDNTIVTPARYSNWIIPVNSAITYLQSNAETFYQEFRSILTHPDAPLFSIDGEHVNEGSAEVDDGYVLTIEDPNSYGTIYFRTDGLDPRIFGGESRGEVREGTQTYTLPLSYNEPVCLRSRVLANGRWSPLNFLDIALPSGSFDDLADHYIHVYPNPFRNEIYAQVPGDRGSMSAEIYSISGKLLFSVGLNGGPGNICRITPDNLETGPYIFMLKAADGTVLTREKVIKTE